MVKFPMPKVALSDHKDNGDSDDSVQDWLDQYAAEIGTDDSMGPPVCDKLGDLLMRLLQHRQNDERK